MSAPTDDVQRYLERPLDDLLGELALYREQATGGALRSPSDAWDRLAPALRERVCVQWSWCQRRQDQRFEENLTLATLLVEVVAPAALTWQAPAALIAAILVKKGLDWFCRCPPVGS